jgi:hypothetical protein
VFWLLASPGILAMLGENDGPSSMVSYTATGAAYGMGLFLPFIVVTFAMAVKRIKIADVARRTSVNVLSRLVLEWKIYRDVRPGPGSAVDADQPAQGLDPVGQAGQARTAGGIGPADAVVADRQ